jgi:thiamine-phosphate pyrophosphorylase
MAFGDRAVKRRRELTDGGRGLTLAASYHAGVPFGLRVTPVEPDLGHASGGSRYGRAPQLPKVLHAVVGSEGVIMSRAHARHRSSLWPGLDPTLYLVTDPALAGGRPLVDVVAAAVQGGVTLVQLRDKQAEGRALLEQARALKALLDPLGVPLLINDRADIALAAGAAGCHVGQTDLPVAEARALLGADAILGTSLDAVEQACAVDPEDLDYVAYGPFAATATKADAGPPIGAAGLAAVRALTALPLVAIGGVHAGNLGRAIEAGADGIAVVSAIMAAADPTEACRRLRSTIEAARQREVNDP